MKVDLGTYLQAKLQQGRTAPHVKLHLVGKGIHRTGPIVLRGVEHCTIYFDPATGPKADPLTLEFQVRNVGGDSVRALIDAEESNLTATSSPRFSANSAVILLPSWSFPQPD